MLQPRTPRKLSLQQQRDMLAGILPDDLLFNNGISEPTDNFVEPENTQTDYQDLFGYRNPQTYLERRQMMRGESMPTTGIPPVSGSEMPTNQSTSPQSLSDVDRLYQSGQISREQADQYELLFSNENDATPNPNIDENGNLLTDNISAYRNPADPSNFPLINASGSDLGSEIYSLGMAIGAKPGTKGRGLGIVGAGGAAALDIAGTLLSGIGLQKRNQYIQDFNRDKQKEVQYDPNSQSANANTTGGLSYGEYGGVFYPSKEVPKFPDGGTAGNPNYDRQLAVYNRWNDPSKFINKTDRVLQGAELDAWYAEQIKNNPALLEESGDFVGGFKPVRVNLNEGNGSYYPIFEKPGKYVPPTTAPSTRTPAAAPTSAPEFTPGYRSLTINGDGYPGVDNPNAKAGIRIPYGSPEELRALELEVRNIKSYKDYKNSSYYEKYKDKVLTFENGGTMAMNKKEGDMVTFKYGGKKVSGVIKRIENGKIYL